MLRAAFCTSDKFSTPNDASLCSSRGSLIQYNSVSRTASHTETSQGVLQAGDHVKSNQIPIKISSGAGRLLQLPAPHTPVPSLCLLPLPHAGSLGMHLFPHPPPQGSLCPSAHIQQGMHIAAARVPTSVSSRWGRSDACELRANFILLRTC